MRHLVVVLFVFVALCCQASAQTSSPMSMPSGWALANATGVKAIEDGAEPGGGPKRGFTLSASVTLAQPCYDLKIIQIPSTVDHPKPGVLTYAIVQHRNATICNEMVTVKPVSQRFQVTPPLPPSVNVRSLKYALPKPAQVVPITAS
jgi:hypothetical protein